jgi:DNA modification methylase
MGLFLNDILSKPSPINTCFRDICDEVRSVAYANHWIHRYPGKLIPHIPRFFLESKLSDKNQLVLDPFCGSGTVLVEALISGNNAVGIDVNPLARFVSKVKTTKLEPETLKEYASDLLHRIHLSKENSMEIRHNPKLDYWFSEETQEKLYLIKREIEKIPQSDYCDFFRLVFSSIIRKTSYADPRIPPACKSKRMREKVQQGWVPKVFEEFEGATNQALKYHQDFWFFCSDNNEANIINANSEDIPISDCTVDLVITSPPYINAQKYMRSTKNEILWLGLIDNYEKLGEIDKSLIGTERVYRNEYNEMQGNMSIGHRLADEVIAKIEQLDWRLALIVFNYFKKMKKVLGEIYRVLVPGHKVIIVIGNNTIAGQKVHSSKILMDLAIGQRLKLSKIYVDDIVNRGLMTKRNKTANMINREWVFLFEK